MESDRSKIRFGNYSVGVLTFIAIEDTLSFLVFFNQPFYTDVSQLANYFKGDLVHDFLVRDLAFKEFKRFVYIMTALCKSIAVLPNI